MFKWTAMHSYIHCINNNDKHAGLYCKTLKLGFHYPSWRPELTAGVDGWPVSITRQHGWCWRGRGFHH